MASARDLGCVLTWVGTEAGGRKPSHPGIGQFLSGVVLVPPLGLKPAKLQEGSDLGVAMASACVAAPPNGQGPAAEPSPLRAAQGENTHCGASSTWSTVVTASALPGREERGTGYRQVGTRPGSREIGACCTLELSQRAWPRGVPPGGMLQRARSPAMQHQYSQRSQMDQGGLSRREDHGAPRKEERREFISRRHHHHLHPALSPSSPTPAMLPKPCGASCW